MTSQTVAVVPSWAFMRQHPAHWIALGAGSGLSPRAPGTVGTLWAWASFLVFNQWLTPWAWGVVIMLSLLLGQWACTVTAQHLGTADPGVIVGVDAGQPSGAGPGLCTVPLL
jgi:phosphatidylglycerophosphatase A